MKIGFVELGAPRADEAEDEQSKPGGQRPQAAIAATAQLPRDEEVWRVAELERPIVSPRRGKRYP